MKHIITVTINGVTKPIDQLTYQEKQQLDMKIVESFKQVGLII